MRCDIRFSSAAPEYAAACSTSSRRFSVAAAMRSPISARFGRMSGTFLLGPQRVMLCPDLLVLVLPLYAGSGQSARDAFDPQRTSERSLSGSQIGSCCRRTPSGQLLGPGAKCVASHQPGAMISDESE